MGLKSPHDFPQKNSKTFEWSLKSLFISRNVHDSSDDKRVHQPGTVLDSADCTNHIIHFSDDFPNPLCLLTFYVSHPAISEQKARPVLNKFSDPFEISIRRNFKKHHNMSIPENKKLLINFSVQEMGIKAMCELIVPSYGHITV